MALRTGKRELEAGLGEAQAEISRLQTRYEALGAQHERDLADVRADAESATKAVLKSAMGTLQLLAEEQQVLLDGLLRKYGDDADVLADLMSVDHTGSQFSRRAKGISVLCGGWLGRREGSATIYDVARSAQGRIKDFNRVAIHSQVNVSVAGKAVEPLAVVLAELLDNATTYSAPGAPVEVNIQTVPSGVCFIVDDAGLGMNQETKERAAALLSTDGVVDITSLGDPPRVGFAVSGMLAARYGFAVSVGSVSPYGGVRAVIRVPETLLAADEPEPQAQDRAQDEDQAQDGRAPERQAVSAVPAAAPAPQRLASVPGSRVGPAHVVGTTSGGLPKRRRRQGPVAVVPAVADDRPAAADPATARTVSEVTASRIGAFARGTRIGRDDTMTTEGLENQ